MTERLTCSHIIVNDFTRLISIWFLIKNNFKPRPKKVVLFLEIDQMKIFLSLTRPHSQCVSEYIFLVSNKQKNKQKKAKKTKEKKRESPENWLKKVVNLQPPTWIFFSLSAFPETRVLFLAWCNTQLCCVLLLQDKGTLFLIEIQSMRGWTAATRHGVTIKSKNKDNLIKAYKKAV